MNRLLLACLAVLAVALPASGQDDSEQTYQQNRMQAEFTKTTCEEKLNTASIPELLSIEKKYLDNAFDTHFKLMSLTLDMWEGAIELDVSMGIPVELVLKRMKIDRESGGYNLILQAVKNCIESTMKRIAADDSPDEKVVDLLMDYYALYHQVYELDKNPSGSYRSYAEALGDLKTEQSRLDAKLALFIPE